MNACVRVLIISIAGPLFATAHAQASGLYLQSQEVAKSSYYTGTPGQASAKPLTSKEWLDAHQGQTADLAIRDYGFLIENAQLNLYIYAIANRLLAQWPGTAPSFAIFVQGNRAPLVYSAATAQSQEIFISYGVFMHAESEDELAAVIGHELAHVLLEHGKSLELKKNMDQSLEAISEARDLYATADALRYNDATQAVSIDPSVEVNLKKSADQKIVAETLYTSAHATLFSRGNEQDADRLALDLLIAAGYSPMGLKASLERMAHSYDLSQEISSYFEASSKSLLQESLTAVNQYMSDNQIQSQDLSQFVDDAQGEFKSSGFKFGKQALLKFTSQSHPVPEKRVDEITVYLYDNYPREVRRRKLDSESIDTLRAGGVADLINNYTAANRALEVTSLGDLDLADYLSLSALEVPTAADPYTRYSAFFVNRSKGNTAAALADIEAIDPDGLIPVFATVELADYLADATRTGEANGMIVRYENYYGTIDGYYPPKIKVALAADDSASVEQLAQACFATAPPESSLGIRCSKASGGSPPVADKQSVISQPVRNLKNLFKGEK